MKSILLISGLLLCSCLLGQTDLREDAAFFEEQGRVYQQWLERIGLAQYMEVHLVEVDSDLVSIYLRPGTEYVELFAAKAMLEELRSSYEQEHSEPLGQRLLHKMLYLMELGDHQANVQFFNSYDSSVRQMLYSRAWFYNETGVFQDLLTEGSLIERGKGEELDIEIDLSASGDCSATEKLAQGYSRREVYERIVAYAQKRFITKTCEDREPQLKIRRGGEILRFDAEDLCRTVLYDESNSVLCRISSRLGFSCNTIERERLHFIIKYQPTESGFVLECSIDGKYADTWGTPRRGDFKSMEENPEFAEYLTLFAELFTEELRTHLQE